ncbi:MAG TPA: hypothetical protein VGA01_10725, partial [Candidatus Binatia bacterium]
PHQEATPDTAATKRTQHFFPKIPHNQAGGITSSIIGTISVGTLSPHELLGLEAERSRFLMLTH